MTRQKTAFCLALLFSALSLEVLAADGINSSKETPLPLGAGENSAILIMPNGNVGVGSGFTPTNEPQAKLDVEGDIKIGSVAGCTSLNEGSLRYNKAKQVFEGCDGSGTWKQLGGAIWTPIPFDSAPFDINCRYRIVYAGGEVHHASFVRQASIGIGLVCGNMHVYASDKTTDVRWGGDTSCGTSPVVEIDKMCP